MSTDQSERRDTTAGRHARATPLVPISAPRRSRHPARGRARTAGTDPETIPITALIGAAPGRRARRRLPTAWVAGAGMALLLVVLVLAVSGTSSALAGILVGVAAVLGVAAAVLHARAATPTAGPGSGARVRLTAELAAEPSRVLAAVERVAQVRRPFARTVLTVSAPYPGVLALALGRPGHEPRATFSARVELRAGRSVLRAGRLDTWEQAGPVAHVLDPGAVRGGRAYRRFLDRVARALTGLDATARIAVG